MEPLLHASPAIQIHVYAAVAAIVLGAYVFARRKGTATHRRAGRLWVFLMVIVCLSSFAIHEIRLWGRWSPIHILSVLTLISLATAVHLVRRGQIRSHRLTMISTYFGSLVIAGVFSFMPGRIMYELAAKGVDASVGAAGALFNVMPLFAWLPVACLPLFVLWHRRHRVTGR